MPAPEALTFESLCADIERYTERSESEFVEQIPRLIMLAENRLATEAKNLGFLRVVEGKFTATNPVLQKPKGWRQTKTWTFVNDAGEFKFLLPGQYSYCKAFNSGLVAGEPEYFADNYHFDYWYIARAPQKAWSFEVSFYERPEPLSDGNQTNWTTRNAPQLLLYACLLEAQPFLKNQALLQLWQAQYAEMIAALQREEAGMDKLGAGAA